MAKQFCLAFFAASSVYPRTSHEVDMVLVKATIGSLVVRFLCSIDRKNARGVVFPIKSPISRSPILFLSLIIPVLYDCNLENACCMTNMTSFLMNCGNAVLM